MPELVHIPIEVMREVNRSLARILVCPMCRHAEEGLYGICIKCGFNVAANRYATDSERLLGNARLMADRNERPTPPGTIINRRKRQ
jgi:hypothetical protein